MLTAYRRHSAKCPHNAKGRDHKNCKCPIWADGVLGNREVRLSVKTRDWNEAARKILRMEAEGRTGGRVLLTTAWDSFLALKESDGVSASVIKKYKLLRRRLEEFTEPRRIEYVNDCSLAILTEFRVSWKWGLRTSAKHLERLKSFFAFCAARHWTAEGNPADKIKAPVGAKEICPTLPFTQAEMIKLLTACDTYTL